MRVNPSILVHSVSLGAGACPVGLSLNNREFQFAVANWVQGLSAWNTFETITFVRALSVQRVVARYQDIHDRYCPGVPYFFAVERNPSRDGHHVHAMLAAPRSMRRDKLWSVCFANCGRTRIEPIRCANGVVTYCAKYVSKEFFQRNGWWNFYEGWRRDI